MGFGLGLGFSVQVYYRVDTDTKGLAVWATVMDFTRDARRATVWACRVGAGFWRNSFGFTAWEFGRFAESVPLQAPTMP